MTRRNSPAIAAIVAEGFLSRLAFGVVNLTLPLYLHSIGMSIAAIAALSVVNSAVAVLLKPVMGRVADRRGLKLSLSTAIALRSAMSLMYAVVALPWQLFGLRAGHGVADSLRDPAINALIAEHGGRKAVASSFAWYQTAKTFAGSVGKGAAGIALGLTADNYGLVFAIASALSALPLVVVAAYVREPARGAPDDPVVPQPVSQQRPPGAVRFAVLSMLVSASASMLGNLFPLLATQYAGLTPAQVGLLYAATPFLAFTGRLFGRLADLNNRLVLPIRGVANIFSSVCYLLWPSFPGFFTGRFLDDLGKAAYKPAWGSLTAHVSSFDRTRRARVMGVISSGEDVGDLLAPLMAGLLWQWWGVGVVLVTRLGISVAAEVYAIALTHSLPPQRGRHRAPRAASRARRREQDQLVKTILPNSSPPAIFAKPSRARANGSTSSTTGRTPVSPQKRSSRSSSSLVPMVEPTTRN